MTNNMKIYFVLPSKYEDELSTSGEMQQAFELCRQNQIIPEWISEVNILTTNFNKEDIVVFETFEGNTFQQVKTRLRIVGPWCIITCLLEGLQVPSNKSPIFNLAMYKLTVTASNYTVGQKKNIKEKVEMMGGVFSLSITHHVTHLITNSVRTQKYAVANTKGVHVMLSSWIDDVWNSSLTRNVKATDAEFEKHKCPCFQNLRMSSTGFEIAERKDLQKIITENGGTYSGKFVTSATDILICKPGLKSEKFQVAKKAKVPCVRIEWIYDSEKKGFALPEKNYVIKVASSTPTKGDVPLNPDFSMMSIISGVENNDPNKTSVSATFNCSMLNVDTPQHRNLAEQKENQEPDLVAGIDLQTVRKAGAFLDGCGVLLAGFNPGDRDKLCRILKSAGATRYDTMSDRVTHVLVGDPTSHEVRLFGGQAPFVSAGWLVESIRCEQSAPEEPYIIQIGAQAPALRPPSSPLSKKGLTLLLNDTTIFTDEPVEKPQPEPEPKEHESIQIYKNNKNKTEEDTLAQLLAEANDIDTNCDTNTNISEEQKWFAVFENKTFKLIDQPEEYSKRLKDALEEVGGIIVENNFNGVTDYAVFPAIVKSVHHVAAAEVVSGIWILDCFSLVELVLPQYYHQLLSIAGNGKTLEGCVITISGYSGFERQFLISVIRGLGGTYQDKFAKISKNGVLGNTHLVCLEEEGGKWEAAKRWNKYIVTHAWLLRCAGTGHRAPENDYLLGNNDSNQSVAVSMVAPSTANNAEVPIFPARLKTKLDSEDTKNKNTLTPCNVKPNSDVTKNIKTPVVGTSVSIMNEVLVTPAPLNMERDSDSKRKSPEPPAPAGHISAKISPEAKRKLIERTPLVNQSNVSAYNDQPGEPMLTLEDGRLVLLSTYMNELRAAGVFDPPTPIQPAPGTPIQEVMARLQREGKIPPPKDVDSPFRSSEPGGGSQSTPVGRYLRGLQERNMLPNTPKNTPDSPLPSSFFDVKTPETPLGRFMEDDPSRSTRKHWQRYLDRFPNYSQHNRSPAPQRRPSTPWSEVKRTAWSWLSRDDASSAPAPAPAEEIELPVTESQIEVSNQIGQFQDMLKSRVSSGPSRSLFRHGQGASSSSDPGATTVEAKDSQTDTVRWEEPMEDCVFTETETSEAPTARKFMISTVETNERANCCNIICSLGGEVSDLKFFDSTATHLICSNPLRNEKILSSMAAGTWVLHHSYVRQSAAAGRFLPEEEYALGNPKSADNLASLVKPSAVTEAINWWCSHVRQTGKGAFHGMRAIVFSKNTEAIVRLIEAGGGTILQASPPFAHSIDITHCLLDVKINLDYNDFIPLAKQGVPCVNILYLSNYLNNRTNVDVKEYIIPSLRDYYN